MANIVQNILIRTDLGFPTGLMAAQVAHIHAEALRNFIIENTNQPEADPPSDTLLAWLQSPYILVRGVPNLETLEYFRRMAEVAGLSTNLWRDTVFSKVADDMTLTFSDVPIGISIGPSDSDKIKAIVGKLPLL